MENPFKYLFSSKNNTKKEEQKPIINKIEKIDNNNNVNSLKENKSTEKVMSRRLFLKTAVGFGVGMMATNEVVEAIDNFLKKHKENNSLNDDNKELQSLIEQLREEENNKIKQEADEIVEDDARPIKELVNYRIPGRIDLTGINTLETLTSYWKKRYKEDYKLKTSLEKAYFEMGAYDKRLKEIFKENGVPEEYCYLAIPESHWDMSARSGAGAVGPYQFISKTAKRWDLQVEDGNDERMNPMRSGWACAKELKYLYDSCGDWDLALSGYNGGHIWGYLDKSNKKNPEITPYRDFLGYIEEKINDIRDAIKKPKFRICEVVKNDTLEKIAKKYNRKKEELIKLNGISNNKIIIGQSLLIPYADSEKENDFDLVMKKAGYFENLTYPAKFNAVISLINEGFVAKQTESAPDGLVDLMMRPAPKANPELITKIFPDKTKADVRKLKKI